ncbi:MAG: branched-chain amino acid ABC transporter substrate-binding protein [Alphaproteobacteria bacterium]|nr:branched-chain amino acid ABC transporter substrate-binding protein [Rhodospirillales bacterium]MCW9044699.1 branched-chain amino acid ABC transporter substrate-binding protein [Alphaproteobacteria bacterium]
MSIKKTTLTFAAASFAASLMATSAMAADTIKIAFIDPLSGPFASTGSNGLREWKFAVEDLVNSRGGLLGGKKIEVIAFDNKISPKETLIQLKNAIGQGIQYVAQGNSSGVANALTSAIKKHNKRNPDKRVIHLNYAAVDPALTNAKCSYWHFRFDANVDMKMNAITDTIAGRKDIKKVYIIGQDYSFGKAVSAAAVKFLKEKRPDIQIVGNELHPIGKVKDFTPYVTKIKAAGANAIITGNWGGDMLNLAKAATSVGLDSSFFTYYAAGAGITAALGPVAKDKVFNVGEGHANPTVTKTWDDYQSRFKAKHPKKDVTYGRVPYTVRMFAKAVTKAGSAKPIDVARALEGMELTTMAGDKVKMRAEDHQLIMPIQVSVHTDDRIKFDYDNSGWGLRTISSTPAESNALPTTCKMERPKG